MSKKNILVIAGGGKKHLEPFLKAGKKLKLNVVTASFSKLEYNTFAEGIRLTIDEKPLDDFDVVYIRLVGKRFEELALLVRYCKSRGIKVVDTVFEKNEILKLPIPKALESSILLDHKISTPKTYFGTLKKIIKNAPTIFGYPYVIKGTTGKQGHAVWSPRSEDDVVEIVEKIKKGEKTSEMNFVAQEFIKSSQRSRIFVIGEKAIAGITRPTRWRRRFVKKVGNEFPVGKKEKLNPIPKEQTALAIKACKILGINIAGVDILKEDKSGKIYLLEVNSAPRWESVKKDTGIFVEEEILKYLSSLT